MEDGHLSRGKKEAVQAAEPQNLEFFLNFFF